MYTGVAASTVSQGNTKSTIQALLRNRERQVFDKPLPADSAQDKSVSNNCITSSDFSDLGNISIKDFEFINPSSPEHASNSSNQQDNLEHQKDFNYSQKLFHIADGNLYSIFSPIQGRSYGMKPSFLRKQKYTVQECHSRGRKNLRKGLKFHNFLPSESVTSEKDSSYMNANWKVHSECRLREEHGTKQITISNWSQSVQNPPSEKATYVTKNNAPAALSTFEANSPELSHLKEEDDGSDCKSNVSDPYDFNSSFLQNSPGSTNVPRKIKVKTEVAPQTSASTPKKDSLSLVLSSLLEKPLCSEKKSESSDETEIQNKSFQKHRRKPVQTRRIVPYVKYLSIMEENDSLPLDLSSKCLIDNSPSRSTSGDETQNISGKSDLDLMFYSSMCDKNMNTNYLNLDEDLQMPHMPTDKSAASTSMNSMIQNQVNAPAAVLYPLPFNKGTSLRQNGFHPVSSQGSSPESLTKLDMNANHNALSISVDKPYNILNQPYPSNSAFSVQKSFVKEVQSKPRKRNQRSVIKQKLEDTFRQNGFLVKTKQVSDGEATFCKFRQLRKYTRYYLKSLEQHLPDEFHKMWKGFLPPKTVLPPALGASESTSNNAQQ